MLLGDPVELVENRRCRRSIENFSALLVIGGAVEFFCRPRAVAVGTCTHGEDVFSRSASWEVTGMGNVWGRLLKGS